MITIDLEQSGSWVISSRYAEVSRSFRTESSEKEIRRLQPPLWYYISSGASDMETQQKQKIKKRPLPLPSLPAFIATYVEHPELFITPNEDLQTQLLKILKELYVFGEYMIGLPCRILCSFQILKIIYFSMKGIDNQLYMCPFFRQSI